MQAVPYNLNKKKKKYSQPSFRININFYLHLKGRAHIHMDQFFFKN